MRLKSITAIPYLKLGLDKPEKDHLVRLKNQVAILSNTLNADPKGKLMNKY